MKKLLRLIGTAAITLAATATNAQAQPLYHLVQTVPLGGGMKWDYLHFDAASHRLYISHGTEVAVVDSKTDRIIGELAGTTGSHGITVDPATGDVYADSADRKLAIAFNPKTLAPIATISVVRDADGMAYDPASKQIFVTGGDGEAITPINPVTNKPAADIALGGSPEFLAADGAGSLYVNMVNQNQIIRIDTATDKIIAHWPTGTCMSPTGMAIDSTRRLIFSSCHSGFMVILNADTGAITATLPIGMATDAAGFDPVRHRAFSSNGDGTLTVISDTAAPAVLGTVKTELGARTMAVDPATGRVYLVTGTVTKTAPPTKPGGRPHYTFAPGSLKLLVYAPRA